LRLINTGKRVQEKKGWTACARGGGKRKFSGKKLCKKASASPDKVQKKRGKKKKKRLNSIGGPEKKERDQTKNNGGEAISPSALEKKKSFSPRRGFFREVKQDWVQKEKKREKIAKFSEKKTPCVQRKKPHRP